MKHNHIRAGSIVEVNDEGQQMYPEHVGKVGELEGYNSPTEARVAFADSVVEVGAVYLRAITDRNMMTPGERNREIVERRKVVRAAFDAVRHDPSKKDVKASLLDALAGRTEITDALVASCVAIARR